MNLDTSQGYSKIPNTIYRKEANLKGKAPHILAYLQTHKEGYKLSLRKIARDTYSDFRTVKKYLNTLIAKGYGDVVKNALPNYNNAVINSTLKNNNTYNNTQKQQHLKASTNPSIEDNSSKKICANKVLLNNNTSAVKLQHPPLLNNSTRINNKNNKLELIKENNFLTLSYEVDNRNYSTLSQKQLPVFIEVEKQLKQQSDQDTTFKHSEEPLQQDKSLSVSIDRPIKLTTTQNTSKNNTTTSAAELPLIIPLEFVELGKTINQHLDLANEYELFRANKIQKHHTNSNWLNAWKSWLEHGVKKYGKNQTSFLLMHKEQQMDTEVKPLIELTELEKQSKINRLEELVKEYHAKEEDLSNRAFDLKMQSHRAQDTKQKQALRDKASRLEWELIEENKKTEEEFIKLSSGLNLINCYNFDSFYNNFKHKIYKDNRAV